MKHYKLILFIINMYAIHGNNMNSNNRSLNVVFINNPIC